MRKNVAHDFRYDPRILGSMSAGVIRIVEFQLHWYSVTFHTAPTPIIERASLFPVDKSSVLFC